MFQDDRPRSYTPAPMKMPEELVAERQAEIAKLEAKDRRFFKKFKHLYWWFVGAGALLMTLDAALLAIPSESSVLLYPYAALWGAGAAMAVWYLNGGTLMGTLCYGGGGIIFMATAITFDLASLDKASGMGEGMAIGFIFLFSIVAFAAFGGCFGYIRESWDQENTQV